MEVRVDLIKIPCSSSANAQRCLGLAMMHLVLRFVLLLLMDPIFSIRLIGVDAVFEQVLPSLNSRHVIKDGIVDK